MSRTWCSGEETALNAATDVGSVRGVKSPYQVHSLSEGGDMRKEGNSPSKFADCKNRQTGLMLAYMRVSPSIRR